MKKYSLLVFDWDGTLVDSQGLAVTSVQRAAEDLGYPAPPAEEINSCFGLELMEMLEKLMPQSNLLQLAEKFYHYFSEDELSNGFFDNVVENLIYLRDNNFILAIATNRAKVRLERALEVTGVRSLFSATSTADEYGAKPNPAMMWALLNGLNVKNSETLMIGDTIFDMQLASNAGVDGMAVSYGHHSREQLAAFNPIGFIDTIGELRNLLCEN